MAERDAAEVRLRTDDAGLIGDRTRQAGHRFRPVADRRLISTYTGRPSRSWPNTPTASTHSTATAATSTSTSPRCSPTTTTPAGTTTATAARSKFLAEHRHAEDEVRFFVAGRGCFYLHLEPEVLRGGMRGRRPTVGAGRHPALVRHGRSSRLRGDPVLRGRGRLDRRLHRRCIGERFPTLDQLVAA